MPVLYGAIVLPHFCRTVNDVLEDLGKPYKAVLMDNGSTAEGFMQDIVTNKPDLAKCAVLSQRWVSRLNDCWYEPASRPGDCRDRR